MKKEFQSLEMQFSKYFKNCDIAMCFFFFKVLATSVMPDSLRPHELAQTLLSMEFSR